MNYIVRPTNFKSWATTACDKIILTINSCTTPVQLQGASKMVDNFIKVASAEDDTQEIEINNTIDLFYTLINLKRNSLTRV